MRYHSVNQPTNWLSPLRLEIASISAENIRVMTRASATAASCGRLWPALVVAAFVIAPQAASAQNSLFSATPSTGLISPVPATRSDIFGPSNLSIPATPPAQTQPAPNRGQHHRLNSGRAGGAGGAGAQCALRQGRAADRRRPDLAGVRRQSRHEWKFQAGEGRQVSDTDTCAPAGTYIVHVGFGLATAVKPVDLRGTTVHEEFELPAGGLRIEGKVGDVRIPGSQISFDVYKGSQFEAGDRRPIAEHVTTSDVVVVPEGTYYIVSNYGDANSVVRSDIRVQPGKLTDITVTHRAAAITLKLVGDKGGEALANTAWSVLTPGGDVIKESIGAFPRVILAEGEYRAIARNEGKVYEREFKVVTGVDGDVEVLAR